MQFHSAARRPVKPRARFKALSLLYLILLGSTLLYVYENINAYYSKTKTSAMRQFIDPKDWIMAYYKSLKLLPKPKLMEDNIKLNCDVFWCKLQNVLKNKLGFWECFSVDAQISNRCRQSPSLKYLAQTDLANYNNKFSNETYCMIKLYKFRSTIKLKENGDNTLIPAVSICSRLKLWLFFV